MTKELFVGLMHPDAILFRNNAVPRLVPAYVHDQLGGIGEGQISQAGWTDLAANIADHPGTDLHE